VSQQSRSCKVNQTSIVTGLVPGGQPRALSGSFDNPTEETVAVSTVTAQVTDVVEAADETGTCDPGDFAITGTGTGTVVPSGVGQGSWSGLSLALTNTAIPQDACKNAVALITYAVR